VFKQVRHIMLLLLILAGAFQALGQYSMPDSACVGTTRQYGVKGLDGSTYTWMVNKVIQPSTANVMSISWTKIDIYLIEVQEHNENCNGDWQSGYVTVVGQPVLNVPPDQTACESYPLPPITGTNLSGNEAYYDGDPSSGGKKITGPITQTMIVWLYDATSTQPPCTDIGNFKVTIIDPVVPEFDAVSPICAGSALSPLPGTSKNSITGTWAPALNNTVTTEYTFTPDAGQCASVTKLTITVNPIPTATISGTTAVCRDNPAEITFTGNNGTPPYTFIYRLNGGPDLTITTLSGNSIALQVPTGTTGVYSYDLIYVRSEEHTSELQSHLNLVCRLLLEKKKR